MAGGADTTRRDALKIAGMGASGLLLASVTASREAAAAKPNQAGSKASSDSAPDHRRGLEEVQAFLGDIAPGASIGGYVVVDVEAIVSGGIPIKLATPEGDSFCVDVLRFDPNEPSRGIGEVSAVTVVLRNGGGGSSATHEAHGLGAMAMAQAVARRVRDGARVPPGLMTMSERSAHDARR